MNTTRRGQARGLVYILAKNGCGDRAWRRLAAAMATIAALAIVLPTGSAYSQNNEEKTHEISWLHSSPSQVRSFVLFVSPVSGSLADARQIDVGKPGESNASSPRVFSALVPIAADEFVAVPAIGQNGIQSALSEWGQPQPSRPGQPLVVEP